jgi:hypothetical protein
VPPDFRQCSPRDPDLPQCLFDMAGTALTLGNQLIWQVRCNRADAALWGWSPDMRQMAGNRPGRPNRTDRHRVAGAPPGSPALRVRFDNRKRSSIRSEEEKARATALVFFKTIYYDCVINRRNSTMTRRLRDRRIGRCCPKSPHVLGLGSVCDAVVLPECTLSVIRYGKISPSGITLRAPDEYVGLMRLSSTVLEGP